MTCNRVDRTIRSGSARQKYLDLESIKLLSSRLALLALLETPNVYNLCFPWLLQHQPVDGIIHILVKFANLVFQLAILLFSEASDLFLELENLFSVLTLFSLMPKILGFQGTKTLLNLSVIGAALVIMEKPSRWKSTSVSSPLTHILITLGVF